MRHLQWTARVISVAIVLAGTAFACSGEAPEAQRAHGVVESVDAGARRVALDHGDIPGMMKAMTMEFDVAPGVQLEGLQPGTEVDFWVTEEGGTYTVTDIRRSDS